jgi:hypothetical protein
VTLRPPEESDVESAYAWDRDPELAAWNGRPPISVSLSAARRDYLARWEDPSVKTFIIEAGEPRKAIGMATLYDFRHDGCELGIKIGPENLRGRGLASEAVDLLVDYAFNTLGLKNVHAARLREVRLRRGRRRLNPQPLRQQTLHRTLLRAPAGLTSLQRRHLAREYPFPAVS